MNLAEYAAHDGLGLAALLQRGETTPRELGRCVLEAVAAVNPQLNAVIETYADAIEALPEKAGAGPYFGLPILTKDFPLEAGRPGEFGSVFAKGFRSPYDHAFWMKLRAGGLANVGRTTSSEFGLAAATEILALRGRRAIPGIPRAASRDRAAARPPRSPLRHRALRPRRRWRRVDPHTLAAFCGTVGLKPSRGRVTGAPEANAPLLGLAIAFMLTRSIRDCATLLDLCNGAAPRRRL